MFRRVFESVGRRWTHFTLGGDAGTQPWDSEVNKYKRDIMMNAQYLTENTDNETKADAIQKIGLLACTGGPEASKLAASYVPTLLDIVNSQRTPVNVKVEIVRTLSEICHQNKDSQDKVISLGGVKALIDIILVPDDKRLSCWACYTLVCLSVNCVDVLRELSAKRDVYLALKVISEFSWRAWPRNMASILVDMLGVELSGS